MNVSLGSISRCFEGAIPSVLTTCSSSGEPNIAHVSQVYFIDDEHVGVSNQFFTETSANLAENPMASILVIDPLYCDSYQLTVHFERQEIEGPLYEQARQAVEAIAALTGMSGVFAVRAVDVFLVLSCTPVPSERLARR